MNFIEKNADWLLSTLIVLIIVVVVYIITTILNKKIKEKYSISDKNKKIVIGSILDDDIVMDNSKSLTNKK